MRPGATPRPLWRNDLGGWTVRLRASDGAAVARSADDAVLKRVPAATLAAHPLEPTPHAESDRLRWLAGRHPAPEALDAGDDDGGQWLLTRTITAETAVSRRWCGEPETAVRALGEGLRTLHDSLDVAACPWRYEGASPAPVPAELREPFAVDRVVVHGDACAPNTLLDACGRWVAHVDPGALGIGDRSLDLAVGAQSLSWNYGPGWEAENFAAYGVRPDDGRLRAWRDWWNAESRTLGANPAANRRATPSRVPSGALEWSS
nr:phosphotransferase [Microcella alkalica]